MNMLNSNVKKTIEDILKLLYQKAANGKKIRKMGYKVPYLNADDGQFLGTLSKKKKDKESIFNEYGMYGSSYSDLSIFNENGTYGSEDSKYSPFNEFSQNPPKIMMRGKSVGYLTKNDHIKRAIDPDELFEKLDKKRRINWSKLFESLINE